MLFSVTDEYSGYLAVLYQDAPFLHNTRDEYGRAVFGKTLGAFIE
jgi:hypothetical protein